MGNLNSGLSYLITTVIDKVCFIEKTKVINSDELFCLITLTPCHSLTELAFCAPGKWPKTKELASKESSKYLSH